MVDLMYRFGLVEWLGCEGLVYGGINLLFDGGMIYIDLVVLIGGLIVMVYG